MFLFYLLVTIGIRVVITHDRYIWHLSRYVASVATPYSWDFIHLDLDEWILEVGEMLLREGPPSWLEIIAKSRLVNECVERACVMWCFCNEILSSSPLTYTLGFSRGGVKDNLIHLVVVGTQAAITQNRYLHDKFLKPQNFNFGTLPREWTMFAPKFSSLPLGYLGTLATT